MIKQKYCMEAKVVYGSKYLSKERNLKTKKNKTKQNKASSGRVLIHSACSCGERFQLCFLSHTLGLRCDFSPTPALGQATSICSQDLHRWPGQGILPRQEGAKVVAMA